MESDEHRYFNGYDFFRLNSHSIKLLRKGDKVYFWDEGDWKVTKCCTLVELLENPSEEDITIRFDEKYSGEVYKFVKGQVANINRPDLLYWELKNPFDAKRIQEYFTQENS